MVILQNLSDRNCRSAILNRQSLEAEKWLQMGKDGGKKPYIGTISTSKTPLLLCTSIYFCLGMSCCQPTVHSHSIILSCTYPSFIPLFLFPILLPSYFFPFPCHPPPFPAPSPASSSNLFYLFSPSLSITEKHLPKNAHATITFFPLLSIIG